MEERSTGRPKPCRDVKDGIVKNQAAIRVFAELLRAWGNNSCPLLPPPHAAGLAHLPGLSAAHSSSFWVVAVPRAPNHTQASPATRVELSIPSQPRTCTEMPGKQTGGERGLDSDPPSTKKRIYQ